jgi:hypothetical protein
MRPMVLAVKRWTPSSVIGQAARNHPAAATVLLRRALAAVTLGLLKG